MKTYLIALLSFASAFFITACGNDFSATNQVYPYGCYSYVNGQCLNQSGQLVSTTAQFGVTNCSVADSSCSDAPGYFQVSDRGVYEDFLAKGLGACSQNYSGGYYNCSNWWPGKFEMSISAPNYVTPNQYCSSKGLTVPSTMSLYIRAAYTSGGFFQYGYQLVGGTTSYNNGATFQSAAVSVINDCKGFEIRQTYGRYLLQVIIEEGNPNSPTLNYKLAWGSNGTGGAAKVFATGTMYRY